MERRRASWGSVAWVLAAVPALAACRLGPAAPSGASFQVVETLATDTCGPQSGAVDRVVQYALKLGVDESRGTATWAVAASGASASGEYAASTRSFRFSADSYQQLRAAVPAYGLAACVVRRIDVIEGTLAVPAQADAGTPDGASGQDAGDAGIAADAGIAGRATGFTAVETITVGPVEGADCSDAVGASDGQYSALPCTQQFTLQGAATQEP